MEKKINIAKILKDCPKGMELYSPLCGDCKLYDVNEYNIRIETPNKDTLISLYHDGKYCSGGEIMLFPKDKTTWEGFIPPYNFNDGDIIYTLVKSNFEFISIFKKASTTRIYSYVDLGSQLFLENPDGLCNIDTITSQRLATEEEKAELFQAIKDNGYKWNDETKTLEKLIAGNKFTVGAIITNGKITRKICSKDIDSYKLEDGSYVFFNEIHKWKLVPNKFDINTLIAFESRVLVRDGNTEKWKSNFWGFYDIDSAMNYPYECCGSAFAQCIPYEENKHLLGKTDDCDEFYKSWK